MVAASLITVIGARAGCGIPARRVRFLAEMSAALIRTREIGGVIHEGCDDRILNAIGLFGEVVVFRDNGAGAMGNAIAAVLGGRYWG